MENLITLFIIVNALGLIFMPFLLLEGGLYRNTTVFGKFIITILYIIISPAILTSLIFYRIVVLMKKLMYNSKGQ
jgi:hypothetical protein